jgi:hypothetical protein
MHSTSSSTLPRGASHFWLVNAAVALAIEALLFTALLHFGAQGPSDSPSLGWAFYISQMPGVVIGTFVSRSFPEASHFGAVLHYLAPFLIQALVLFVLVSVARLFLGRDDGTA